MAFISETELLIRLILALIFGIFIGAEREYREKPAGVRTHVLVCIGASVFSMISVSFIDDPTRVAANVVTGIGFLGAGAIMRHKGQVEGLTTASDLWATAALGLAAGIGYYSLALLGFVFVFGILVLGKITKHFKVRPKFLTELELGTKRKKKKNVEKIEIK